MSDIEKNNDEINDDYVEALISRAQELFNKGGEFKDPEPEVKPKQKRNYSDETRAKMRDRLKLARQKANDVKTLKKTLKEEEKERDRAEFERINEKHKVEHKPVIETKSVRVRNNVPEREEVKNEPKIEPKVEPKPVEHKREVFFRPRLSYAKKFGFIN